MSVICNKGIRIFYCIENSFHVFSCDFGRSLITYYALKEISIIKIKICYNFLKFDTIEKSKGGVILQKSNKISVRIEL